MKFLTVVLVVIVVLIFPGISFSQFALSAGPALGLNLNLHGGTALPQSGSGLGVVIGGVADIEFNKSIGILASLYFYDVRSGSYSASTTSGGTVVAYDVKANLAYFQIEPLFKYEFPTGLYVLGGFNFGFNLTGEVETVVSTPGFQGSTNAIPNVNSRFEIKAGAGYNYPIGNGMEIAPQLTFGLGLSNVAQNAAWKVSTFQLLVPLKFSLIQ